MMVCGGIFMFRVDLGRVRLGVSFSFPAVIALVLLTGGADVNELLTALLCCVLHECGHLFFMLIFRRRPEAVTLYGGGIKITPPRGRIGSLGRDIAVLAGGCLVNFLLAAAGSLLGAGGVFTAANLMLALFNLMPFEYFDGGRILALVLDGKDLRYFRAAVILLTACIIAALTLRGNVSPSLVLTFLFAAAAELFDSAKD